jgi:7,8-dihydroneopterin aldolase/epimerase/oxygenase
MDVPIKNRNEGWLWLKNLTFWGRHGHLKAERELGNRFELDVGIRSDITKAVQSDDLEETIDLRMVYEIARKRMEQESFSLIETLANTIARDILRAVSPLEVIVRLRKITPPLEGLTTGYMEVEVSLVP